MGLIKKYAAGSTMNYSFDSNNASQQKLIKKKADKNANGLDFSSESEASTMFNTSTSNSVNEKAGFNANQTYKPIKNTFGEEQSKRASESKAKNGSTNTTNLINSGTSIVKSGGIKSTAKSGADGGAVASAAVSGVANAYNVSNDPNATGDDRMNATSNAMTGTIGAINPVIGGAIEVGNMVAAPIKTDAEARNEDGTLKSTAKAKDTALVGMILSPSKAFAFRQELDRQGDKDAWTTTDMSKYTDYLDKDAKAAIAANKIENDRIAEEKRKYLGHEKERQDMLNIQKTAYRGVYKIGGPLKLIPRFRRGGELDLEKQNVILDGPSHDDHNSTGVKNDKGIPVVKGNVKIAEIESLELILNKNSSKEVEKLVKDYKSSGDKKVLDKIGKLMKSEINNNTYDYSKKLIK